MDVPQRVGKYEIVAPLAAGGMAEILLAREVGPSGFERPVALKRILPHRAHDPRFVAMFLDEARIAANVRHPNVVQVHDLGTEGDELFLVMEFLEGESVGALLAATLRSEHALPNALAAHVVAEAAAGLHAAHELETPSGDLQNLVHRDLSPGNVFVTYDGQVKVLDFGIAKVEDRIGDTDVGEVKGKWAYMSPEQCRGQALDRRSDIFALGIVLYELLCGRRLFKRDNGLLTMKAILSAPIARPREIVETCDAELDEICMRALSRDREGRHPTALALRRDLLPIVRRLHPPGEPSEALAALMQECFAARIAEKKEMLRRASNGTPIGKVPFLSDPLVEIPIVPDTQVATRTETPAPRPNAVAWVALAAIVVFAFGVAALISSSNGARAANADVAKSPVEPSAITSSPAPVVSSEISLHVETTPPDARVSVDGSDRGKTPLDVRLPRASDAMTIEIVRPGFKAVRQTVTPDVDQRFSFALVREPTPHVVARPHPASSSGPPGPPAPTAPPAPSVSPSAGFRRFN